MQPGVAFDHTSVIDYQSEKALSLKELITTIPNYVYEAHTSDIVGNADGVYLHHGILKMIYRMKGPKKMGLINDSIVAEGKADGSYRLGMLM